MCFNCLSLLVATMVGVCGYKISCTEEETYSPNMAVVASSEPPLFAIAVVAVVVVATAVAAW